MVYQYEVQGDGEDVSISYLAGDRGPVEERVSLPWTSEEFEGTDQTPVRLKTEGPEGAVVKCLLRHRRVDGEYGANGSGESSHTPDQDQTGCSLNLDRLSAET